MNKHYIFAYANGYTNHRKEVSAEDLKTAGCGVLTIIDITDPEHPLEYYGGGWRGLVDGR